MTLCRTCHLPWDRQGSLFTVCPSCRAKMPVRRVNGEPLNREFTTHLKLDRGRCQFIEVTNDRGGKYIMRKPKDT